MSQFSAYESVLNEIVIISQESEECYRRILEQSSANNLRITKNGFPILLLLLGFIHFLFTISSTK